MNDVKVFQLDLHRTGRWSEGRLVDTRWQEKSLRACDVCPVTRMEHGLGAPNVHAGPWDLSYPLAPKPEVVELVVRANLEAALASGHHSHALARTTHDARLVAPCVRGFCHQACSALVGQETVRVDAPPRQNGLGGRNHWEDPDYHIARVNLQAGDQWWVVRIAAPLMAVSRVALARHVMASQQEWPVLACFCYPVEEEQRKGALEVPALT